MKLMTSTLAALLLASSALAAEPATHSSHTGSTTHPGETAAAPGDQKGTAEAKPSAKHGTKTRRKLAKKHHAKAGDQTEQAAPPKHQ